MAEIPPSRIALVANTAWYLYNFRLNLAKSLMADGYEVIAIAAPDDRYGALLEAAGVRFCALPLSQGGTNPFQEAGTIFALCRLLRREGVTITLSYTPKGNLYAGLAGRGAAIRQIANISGLGRAFVEDTLLTRIVQRLYRFVLKRASWTFFQNQEDHDCFVKAGIADPARSERIPGSGVDLRRFSYTQMPAGSPVFLMIARLIRDKGVAEYVEAARQVRNARPDIRFQLLGAIDHRHPSGVPERDIAQWAAEGTIEYLGATDDVRNAIAGAHCIVLPSFYREGVPRSLLEAAAMGRPVITTDMPGCRDAVEHGQTGMLCRARDAGSLVQAIEAFLKLSDDDRMLMGKAGRARMENQFSEDAIIERYQQRLRALIP